MSNAPTIKLVTNEDWTIWFKALKTKAKNQDLWEYLDPTKPHKPLLISTAPTPPNIKDFRKRSSAITRSTVSNTNTPSSATQDTIVADPTEMDEDYRAREDDDAAILAQDVADLSEKGLRVYNALWTNYEHLSKRHEALKKKVSVLQDWVIETVDQPLARHNFNEEESLADWIKSIHEEFSLVGEERRDKARREYREHLGKPHQSRLATLKSTREWITIWRDAINEARDVDLQEAKEADLWFKDLVAALRASPLESWINAYAVSQRSSAQVNTLKVGEALAAIRLAISEHPEPTKRPRVTHGAFFTAEGTEEEADSDKDTPRKENKRKQPPKKK
jgi:hypothetical protein